MDIIEISEDNLDDFLSLLGEDLIEDLKRVYYSGIGAVDGDGNAKGAFVYELLNSESEEDIKSRIFLVKSGDQETLKGLESYYRQNSVSEDETVESTYELQDEADAKALSETGFSMEKKEDEAISITLKELAATGLGKSAKLPDHIGSIEDLSILQFRDTIKQILFKGHRGNLEDIPYLPKNWFDNSISACINSGEKIPGLFLIRKTPSGILIPALLFAYGPEFKKDLLYMIRFSLLKALQLYPPETIVRIERKSASTKALTDKLMPNCSGEEIFYGTRKEQA
jgi:hypothetical protein